MRKTIFIATLLIVNIGNAVAQIKDHSKIRHERDSLLHIVDSMKISFMSDLLNKKLQETKLNENDLDQVAKRYQDLSQKENWISRLDNSLDPSLAATLAGLAIAAATFLIAFTLSTRDRIKNILLQGGTPSPKDIEAVNKMEKAAKELMASFFVYIGFLVESLTMDQWEEPGSWLNTMDWAQPTDVILAGGALSVGTYLLGRGALTIKSIVIE